MADDQDDAQVYTPDDEPLMHKITRALKSAFGGGPKDVELPDEGPDTPQRRAAFDREKSDDSIRKLQDMGERIRKATAGEAIRNGKKMGMTEEQATRAALRRQ